MDYVRNKIEFHKNGVSNLYHAHLYIIRYLKIIYSHSKVCKRYIRSKLSKYLTSGDALFKKAYNIIINSSSYFVAFYVYEFADLIGRRVSHLEKEFAILVSGLMQTYDKLFDDLKLSADKIDEMLFEYKTYKPSHPLESATIDMYSDLVSKVPSKDKEGFLKTIGLMHQAERDSLRQQGDNISYADMIDITERKGGYNAIILVYNLIPKTQKVFNHLVYSLGFFAQLLDDLNDKAEDVRENIKTFATHKDREFSPSKYLHNVRLDIIKQVDKLCLPRDRKKKYVFRLFTISTIIISIFKLKESKIFPKQILTIRIPLVEFLVMFLALVRSYKHIYGYNYDKIIQTKVSL